MMNPIQLEAMAKVAAACKKYNKSFGIHAGPQLLEKFASDLTLTMSLTDTDLLTQGLSQICKTVRNLFPA